MISRSSKNFCTVAQHFNERHRSFLLPILKGHKTFQSVAQDFWERVKRFRSTSEDQRAFQNQPQTFDPVKRLIAFSVIPCTSCMQGAGLTAVPRVQGSRALPGPSLTTHPPPFPTSRAGEPFPGTKEWICYEKKGKGVGACLSERIDVSSLTSVCQGIKGGVIFLLGDIRTY